MTVFFRHEQQLQGVVLNSEQIGYARRFPELEAFVYKSVMCSSPLSSSHEGLSPSHKKIRTLVQLQSTAGLEYYMYINE